MPTIAAWLLAPAILAVVIALNPVGHPTYLMGDFRAFYCAGIVIGEGANPYLEEPLRTCETTTAPQAGTPALRGVAIPAPLPPHALLPFVLLSRLPFGPAALLFSILSGMAAAAAVLLFARATGASTLELNLVFAAIAGTVTLFVGQPVAFVLLALGATALFVRDGRWWPAGACATAATLEPHVALPAIVAIAVVLPAARIPLLVCLASAASAGVLALGLSTSIAYVQDVLPAHALANAYEWQYSLTSILTSAGVDGPLAVRLGELMFAAMVVLGVAVAARIRRLTGEATALVLVPPAFALFGGVHVHVQQLAAAFPAVLYTCVRFPRVRVAAVSGLSLAMIPWNVVGSTVMAGCAPVLVGAFAALRVGRRAGLLLAVGAAGIELSLLVLAATGLGPAETQFVPRPYPPDALAETSWGDFSHAVLMRPSVLMQWLRVPTLVGFLCMLGAIAQVALGRES